MATLEKNRSASSPLSLVKFLAPDAEPLPDWPLGNEPRYKHLFAVDITDSDPQNPTCEVRYLEVARMKQGDITDQHFRDVMQAGTPVTYPGVTELDLRLDTGGGAFVIFHLRENSATFEHQGYPADVSQVIVRRVGEPDVLYRAKWLNGATDRKAFSVILKGFLNPSPRVDYGLRVLIRSSGTGSPTYLDIDPKIENRGGTRL